MKLFVVLAAFVACATAAEVCPKANCKAEVECTGTNFVAVKGAGSQCANSEHVCCMPTTIIDVSDSDLTRRDARPSSNPSPKSSGSTRSFTGARGSSHSTGSAASGRSGASHGLRTSQSGYSQSGHSASSQPSSLVFSSELGFPDATWYDAYSYCQRAGLQLASLDSKYKNDFVINYLRKTYSKYAWFGLHKDNYEWRFVNGRPLEYLNYWGRGLNRQAQPDSREGEENCVAFLNGVFEDNQVSWHDIGCSHKKPFVCEAVGHGYARFSSQLGGSSAGHGGSYGSQGHSGYGSVGHGGFGFGGFGNGGGYGGFGNGGGYGGYGYSAPSYGGSYGGFYGPYSTSYGGGFGNGFGHSGFGGFGNGFGHSGFGGFGNGYGYGGYGSGPSYGGYGSGPSYGGYGSGPSYGGFGFGSGYGGSGYGSGYGGSGYGSGYGGSGYGSGYGGSSYGSDNSYGGGSSGNNAGYGSNGVSYGSY